MPLVILSLFHYEHTFLSCESIWQIKDNINVFAASIFFIALTYDTFQPYKIDSVVDSLLNSHLIHTWCTDYIWKVCKELKWYIFIPEHQLLSMLMWLKLLHSYVICNLLRSQITHFINKIIKSWMWFWPCIVINMWK